jgi:hypothetical protein
VAESLDRQKQLPRLPHQLANASALRNGFAGVKPVLQHVLVAARAQQGEPERRVGALINLTADDLEAPARVTALEQGLQQLGWTVGRNVRIDYRWGAVDVERSRRYAAELVALVPEVILANAPRPWWRCSRRRALCRSCS